MIDIKFEFENKRAAAYDNKKLIGESTISPSEKFWIIDHTEVDENYGGKGIAKKLIEIIVNEAKKRDLKILPLCPYAKKEFEKNKEYQEIMYR
ncbi:GNAT family N-acetyltransferase [Fusobacterium sp.]|uniref:GNAT family N-acetyltransferase n=1 Tax=Fusobacterium sp. TaxID=68766 RepID=UPI00261FDB87|nr:GNAT family N-acetyltransferase [Fusobacterium sp.]